MIRNIRSVLLVFIVVPLLLSGCVSMPSRDERFVMVVKNIPFRRQELQDSPGLSLALMRGVNREDVTSGRLVRSGCYFRNPANLALGRRFGFTLLPAGMKFDQRATITVLAEEADGTDGPFARFFGRYIQRFNASEVDFFKDEYVSGDAFRCRPISSTGEMEVAILSTVKYWDYDFASAELSRNSGIRDDELKAGRIAMGECSPGIDSWALWTVRIPEGLHVKAGDYVEAIAGAHSGSTAVGPISTVIRKVAEPQKSEFIRTQGRDTVSCSARAEPVR